MTATREPLPGRGMVQSGVLQSYFRVLLAVDRLQRATIYSVAHELGYTRSAVQTALKVGAEEFRVAFEREGSIYRIVDWGVLNHSALVAFMGAETASENIVPAKQDELDGDDRNPNHGIRRIDDDLFYARRWQVTIKRNSGQFERIFSDGTYGGKDAAWRAAKSFYDEKILECPLMPRVERVAIVRKNNTSGTPGVFRWPADGREDRKAYWAAKWVETMGAKPVSKKFHIRTYGEEVAKLMAISAREQALNGLIDG